MKKYEMPEVVINLFSPKSSIMDASSDLSFEIPGDDVPPFTGEFD